MDTGVQVALICGFPFAVALVLALIGDSAKLFTLRVRRALGIIIGSIAFLFVICLLGALLIVVNADLFVR